MKSQLVDSLGRRRNTDPTLDNLVIRLKLPKKTGAITSKVVTCVTSLNGG